MAHDSFEEDKALASGHVCFGCMGRQAEIERLRAELATEKKLADLCDFAPEADRLAEENKTLRAENAALREALEMAQEAMIERRLYCEQWERKYGVVWSKEDAAVDAALSRPAAPKEET